MKSVRNRIRPAALVAVIALGSAIEAAGFDVVLSTQGEYIDAYFYDGTTLEKKVLVAPDDPTQGGRHLNGKVCFFPSSAPSALQGKFVAADDTYREACVDVGTPQARCDPSDPNYVGNDADGWGVFNSDATWAGTVISTGTPSDPDHRGTSDPQGCVFDAAANLIGNNVGSGQAGVNDGDLIIFFAGSDYTQHCFLATSLGSPGMPVMNDGVIYVPQSGGGVITKFSAPFPTSPSHCQLDPGLGVPVPDTTHTPTQETFVVPGELTPISLARRANALGLPGAPESWYIGSVLITPTILEVVELGGESGAIGVPVRSIVPPFVPKNPIGMDVGSDGTVYYAELNLTIPDLGTGCGRVSMVKFDETGLVPLPPAVLRENLRFPDGITVLDSGLFAPGLFDDDLPDAPVYGPSNCGGE